MVVMPWSRNDLSGFSGIGMEPWSVRTCKTGNEQSCTYKLYSTWLYIPGRMVCELRNVKSSIENDFSFFLGLWSSVRSSVVT